MPWPSLPFRSRSPEDQLLLQFQGMIAEYERAQILERSRRGKRHRAKQGEVSVLSGAPYGYHYDRKSEERLVRYAVIDAKAQVVRQIYDLYTTGGFSINAVARRLSELGVPTRKGAACWEHSTVWAILRNPAYRGMVCFGKTHSPPGSAPTTGRCASAAVCPRATAPITNYHAINRSGFRFPRWSIPILSRWRRNGSKETGSTLRVARANRAFSRVLCTAASAATLCTGPRRVAVPARFIITAVWAVTPGARTATLDVARSLFGLICWNTSCDRKLCTCWRIPRSSRPSWIDAWRRRVIRVRPGVSRTASLRSWPRRRNVWTDCSPRIRRTCFF